MAHHQEAHRVHAQLTRVAKLSFGPYPLLNLQSSKFMRPAGNIDPGHFRREREIGMQLKASLYANRGPTPGVKNRFLVHMFSAQLFCAKHHFYRDVHLE
ncbi:MULTISPECIES: hypothetical protein [Paraburkholderia]|uniref:Uncharacterized protein n=1 Tax=Paraburkholderia dipogonis TaxID=1211383 RepID=A0ABW9AWW1_9BURK